MLISLNNVDVYTHCFTKSLLRCNFQNMLRADSTKQRTLVFKKAKKYQNI